MRWRVAKLLILACILAIAIVSYVYSPEYGEWTTGSEWSIGDDWIVGGAGEEEFINYESTSTSGVRPFAAAIIELGGGSSQISRLSESVGCSASLFMSTNLENVTLPDPPIKQGSVTLDEDVILYARGDNASFIMNTALSFLRTVVTPVYVWMDQSYTARYYTPYCLYSETSDVSYQVIEWFPTENSTGRLTINNPASSDLLLGFYSPNLITAWAEGVVSYQFYSDNNTLRMVCNSDVNPIIIHVTTSESEMPNIPPEIRDFEITDMEGCGNWVFSEEQYYHFQATYWDGDGVSDFAYLKVAFTDSVNWVSIVYNATYDTFHIENGTDYIRMQRGTATATGVNTLEVTFIIYFRNTIIDAQNVDVWLRAVDSEGSDTLWTLLPDAEDYFHIYNLGGHSELTTGGTESYYPYTDAGRIDGGDVFDLYAKNSSYAEASVVFRNLQHIKLLPQLEYIARSPAPGIYLEYYIDQCTEDTDEFTNIMYVRISHQNFTVGSSEQYAGFLVSYWEWIGYGWTQQKVEFIRVFQPVAYENDTIRLRFWIDLWFNRINASTTIGARVNAYYFPMTDSSPWYLRWLTGENWGILDTRKESMGFMTMHNNGSSVLHTQEIKLVRVRFRLNKGVQMVHDDEVKISEHMVFDLTIGDLHSPFVGIQTPVFDESVIPIMPQGGFLGALWSGLVWLAQAISDALGPPLLNLWNVFVGFLDTVAGWFGYPTFFTDLFSFLSSAGGWFVDSLGYLVVLLTSVFALAAESMEGIIFTVVTVSGVWVNMLRSMFQFLGSTFNTGINIWEDLGGIWWLTIGAILYPLYLLFVWEDQGLDAVINQVTFLFNVASFIGHGLITVVQFILNIIGRIIESIPVVE